MINGIIELAFTFGLFCERGCQSKSSTNIPGNETKSGNWVFISLQAFSAAAVELLVSSVLTFNAVAYLRAHSTRRMVLKTMMA